MLEYLYFSISVCSTNMKASWQNYRRYKRATWKNAKRYKGSIWMKFKFWKYFGWSIFLVICFDLSLTWQYVSSVYLISKTYFYFSFPPYVFIEYFMQNKHWLKQKSWVNHYLQKQPPEFFVKKGVLKNFANITGKHLCWTPFLMKLQAFRLTTLVKRTSNTGVFLNDCFCIWRVSWTCWGYFHRNFYKIFYTKLKLLLVPRKWGTIHFY